MENKIIISPTAIPDPTVTLAALQGQDASLMGGRTQASFGYSFSFFTLNALEGSVLKERKGITEACPA